MDNNKEVKLRNRMLEYYSGDPSRIQHFIKVHAFAAMIGEEEKLPEETLEILRAAALVHDIGIKAAEEKFGSHSGKLQEQEGPAEAESMLAACGYGPEAIARISFLVGHHHTYTGIDGPDYRILVEADFLVNLFEEGLGRKSVWNAYKNIFVTEAGRRICRTMFRLEEIEEE